jgi:hypothetical protein
VTALIRQQATELELSINGSKCAILIFGKQKTKETIEIDNATAKIAENYRYLGITIDRHLHFGPHVKELHTALQRRLNIMKYISSVKWGGQPKVLNILYKNFIRSKMDYVATTYGNAPTMRLRKLDTLQNTCLSFVGGFSMTTPVHVLSTANTIPTPEQRRTWMTGKEVVKTVLLNTPLGIIIRKLLETHDTTAMQKTVFKIRHLVEAMDEEKISFHEQTTQNLVIETGLEGI